MKTVERSFIPGSEWIYFKIYLGPKTVETILHEELYPKIQTLAKNGIIDKWFFVRFKDPNFHLRLRFHFANPEKSLNNIFKEINPILKTFLEEELIWKIELGTYERELERYGNYTIELAENIFWIDSEACLKFLSYFDLENHSDLRWLFGLKSIDNLLNSFELNLVDKIEVLEFLKTGYGQEFGMSRPLKKQLDVKYRKYQDTIKTFLDKSDDEDEDFRYILKILTKSSEGYKLINSEVDCLYKQGLLEVSKFEMMLHLIHMSMNRLFESKNRLNEMVCYDFLYRYYKTTFALANKNKKAEPKVRLK